MATLTAPRTRRQVHPGRKTLGLAAVLVIVGSFLPWLHTFAGVISGANGPGLWTFYAAVFGVAGALMPWRRVGAVHAVVLAAVALVLPIWQVVHVIGLVGLSGWMPGPGLVVVFTGGVLAAAAARRLLQAAPQ
ncbi:hypothetical protein [Nocardioides limicola]|uniref:hypothetical protein n=1 Tax=Nocardioides limicola TaxID=2803368 RepID=UPI00193C80BC|nr:hypothetical protein [Nocardioides sp. DJM-14]